MTIIGKIIIAVIVVVLVGVCSTYFGKADELPTVTNYVMDSAHILSPKDRVQLGQKLAKHTADDPNKSQVVILLIPKLPEDTTIEQFATDTFHKAGIGKKGKDNGVLTVVAVEDRKIRIEVGYGLEPTLTDSATKNIIDQIKQYLHKGQENWIKALNVESDLIFQLISSVKD